LCLTEQAIFGVKGYSSVVENTSGSEFNPQHKKKSAVLKFYLILDSFGF
jgi:hypothetical protein